LLFWVIQKEMTMKTSPRTAARLLRRAAFLAAAVILPACGTTQSTLHVNTPPASPFGKYKSVQIICTSDEEKAKEYTSRLESQVMVKLKERETFQEYRLSKDAGQAELLVKVNILDLKRSSGAYYGWYTRNSSKVNCDVTFADAKSNETVGAISVIARPKLSNIEQAIEDAATQIADYLRENK